MSVGVISASGHVPGAEVFLEFQCVAANALSSRAIEYFGGGGLSHVDIVWPGGRLFGARSEWITVRGLDYPPGVQFRPPDYLKYSGETFSRIVRIYVPCTLEERARGLTWLLKQENARYDKRAILGFATGRDWRTEGEWFCSELATRYLEVAQDFTVASTTNKIPPGTFACIATARPRATEHILLPAAA